MKVLGICASPRKLGNSEILLKEALMGAEEEGAQVEILRLTDYHILPCEGLATCMFGGSGCKFRDRDDHDYLLRRIEDSDGLILSAPCYLLEVNAPVKQFIDRLFVLTTFPPLKSGKPAGIIVPYATRGWTSYALVQPNIMLRMMRMEVIDQVTIHIQGMSESANDQRVLDRARLVGKRVARAVKTGDTSYQGQPGICPVCHDRNIRILKDNETVECPLCNIRGKLTLQNGKIKVHFPEEQLKWHRFAAESMYRHVTYEMKPSKDYFMKVWPTLKEKRKKYQAYLHIDREPATEGGN